MPPPRGLNQKLDQSLHRSNLLPPKSKLLLAVSGDADSVALLCLLNAINQSKHWQWQLAIAHIDHGIRGESSKLDAAFVKQLAKKLKLPCTSKSLRLGPNISEDAARHARLRALGKIATTRKIDLTVLAHHADDQAETVLHRILRGTGLEGLRGIPPRMSYFGLEVARPLLQFRRSELRAYLANIDQDWREDESNASDQYLRNQLRNHLLPEIEKLFPAAADSITRLAALARQAYSLIITQMADLRAAALITESRTQILFKWKLLHEAHPALLAELLRNTITRLGGSSETTDFERLQEGIKALQSSHGNKSIQLGNHITLHLQKGTATLTKQTPPA